MAKKRPLYCVDLFAGCGGLSLGLEQAGFEPLAYCEINKDAADSYSTNRGHLKVTPFGGVDDMTPGELERLNAEWKRDHKIDRVDLVCGGPPCQGYSGIGHRRSYQVERHQIPSNHLYKEMIRVIETLQPRAFLFENVRGLLSGRWTKEGRIGEIWDDVSSAFQAIEGYKVGYALVQAKDYGVPQNRPRVLLVGIRDLSFTLDEKKVAGGLLPEPKGGAPDLKELLHDLVDRNYLKKGETTEYLCDPKSEVQDALRRTRRGHLMKKGEPLTEQVYSKHSEKIRLKFEAMHQTGGEIPAEFRTKKFAQRLLKPHWGPEGPNITATSLPDDFVHYAQPRTLTVREWARLQMFPDWYQFCGPRTTGGTRRAGIPTDGVWERDVPRYTQIGNAVPVGLAFAVGKHLAKLLRD